MIADPEMPGRSCRDDDAYASSSVSDAPGARELRPFGRTRTTTGGVASVCRCETSPAPILLAGGRLSASPETSFSDCGYLGASLER